MRFLLMLKATRETESGALPSPEIIAAMDKFNESMMKAGVFLSADGLQPSAKGARVSFSGGKRTVTDGPFTETKELIAGFWMIQVKSKEEAIEWASRCPGGDGKIDHLGGTFVIEVRQLFDMSDFPAELQDHAPAAKAFQAGAGG
jgi:hypothetical protein